MALAGAKPLPEQRKFVKFISTNHITTSQMLCEKEHAMKHDFIRRVLVIGEEPMVLEIAWQCATHGYEVIVNNTSTYR